MTQTINTQSADVQSPLPNPAGISASRSQHLEKFEFTDRYAQFGGCAAYCSIVLTVNVVNESYTLELPEMNNQVNNADHLRAIMNCLKKAQEKIYELFPKAVPTPSDLHRLGAVSNEAYAEYFAGEFGNIPQRLIGKPLVVTEKLIDTLEKYRKDAENV